MHELDVWLLAGEMIRPDAGRLFRSRPGAGAGRIRWRRRTASPAWCSAGWKWKGRIYDEWPPAGHKLLFGDLPMTNARGRQDRENPPAQEIE